jgi:hypothetical protein
MFIVGKIYFECARLNLVFIVFISNHWNIFCKMDCSNDRMRILMDKYQKKKEKKRQRWRLLFRRRTWGYEMVVGRTKRNGKEMKKEKN